MGRWGRRFPPKARRVLVWAVLLTAPTLYAQEPNGLAFTTVNVVDVERGEILADQAVVISDNRIVGVGPSGQVSIPSSTRIVDGADKYLVPGFWDMHVHLFDVDTPGATEVTFPLLIANGVTGVRDTGSLLDLLLYWRNEVTTGRSVGPRIVGTGPMLDGPPVVYSPMSTVLRTPNDARRTVQMLAQRGADFVKAYEMLRPDVFLAVVEESRTLGLPVAAHVPLTLLAGDVSNAGVRSFEHLRNIELACSRDAEALLESRIQLLEEGTDRIGSELRNEIHWLQRPLALASYDPNRCAALLDRLAQNETYQTVTLFLSTKESRRPDRLDHIRDTLRYTPEIDQVAWKKWSQAVDSYESEHSAARRAHSDWLMRLVRDMRDAGVPLLAGSDVSVPWMVPGFSLHEELAILVEAGLTPAEALRTATITPANFFGASDRFGSVREGRFADLVLLDANPLNDIANTTRIHGVMANGNYYDRSLLDEMLASVAAAAASGKSDRPRRTNTPATPATP